MRPIRIRFRDLSVPPEERKAILEIVDQVLAEGELILGTEVSKFEAELAQFCKRRYSVALASGTSALYLALRALRIGPGDEVITSPLTWVATTNAILQTGAQPVFVDIADDFLMNPTLVERSISPRTKALLPVDFYGRVCNHRELLKIADSRNLKLVVDGAQSFGASRDDTISGELGHIVAFSLNPMKVLAGIGEAGAVVFDDPEVLEEIVSLRYLGTVNKEVCVKAELNHKIDPLHAAVLRYRLKNLKDLLDRRREIADLYRSLLMDLYPLVSVPSILRNEEPTNFDFVISCERRDELETHLLSLGIEVKVRHRHTVPDQPAYRTFRTANIPNARAAVTKILCLPIHEKLQDSDIRHVATCIHDFYTARNA